MHICNVIIGYTVGGMNKSMLDLYKNLESQERGEKREKWTQTEFIVFPFSIFSLSLLSLFHVNILLYLHKRSSGDHFLVYVCFPKTRNLSSYLRSYITQILEYFCQGQIACNGQLSFQLLWDAYSETCDAFLLLFSQGVPCSSVPTSKLYMST